MTRALVRNRDPEADVHVENYDKNHPDMGIRFVVILSDGRRMPWGNTISHAWRLAHKRLQAEAHPLEGPPLPRFMDCKVDPGLSPSQRQQVQTAGERLGLVRQEKK